MKKNILLGALAICASISMTYATNSPEEKKSKETTKAVSSDYGLCQATYDTAYAQAYAIAIINGSSKIAAAFSAHNYAHSQAIACMAGV